VRDVNGEEREEREVFLLLSNLNWRLIGGGKKRSEERIVVFILSKLFASKSTPFIVFLLFPFSSATPEHSWPKNGLGK
jgi:hypothetical protein